MLKMANDKRLGDVAIVLIIMAFVVSTISSVLVAFDYSIGYSSYGSNQFINLSSNARSSSYDLETRLTNSTDGADKLAVDPNIYVDNRFDSSSGLINLLSKNLFVRFFRSLTNSLPAATFIFTFLLSLIGVSITLLIIRVFAGADRI